ncbi:USP6 N-terminal-like protein [Irineochytrium annulatum]|nr:USP6 N-terminal-like protein [Irineochytrium annulatum]
MFCCGKRDKVHPADDEKMALSRTRLDNDRRLLAERVQFEKERFELEMSLIAQHRALLEVEHGKVAALMPSNKNNQQPPEPAPVPVLAEVPVAAEVPVGADEPLSLEVPTELQEVTSDDEKTVFISYCWKNSSDLYIDARNSGEMDPKIQLILDGVRNHMDRQKKKAKGEALRNLPLDLKNIETIEQAVQLNFAEAVKTILEKLNKRLVAKKQCQSSSLGNKIVEKEADGAAAANKTGEVQEVQQDLLHVAAGNGNVDIVRMLPASGLEVYWPNVSGEPPLWAAMTRKMAEIYGGRLDDVNSEGCTLAHLAVSQGNAAMLEELLRLGCPLDRQTDDGRTPLFMAVEYNYHEIVTVLLSKVPASVRF